MLVFDDVTGLPCHFVIANLNLENPVCMSPEQECRQEPSDQEMLKVVKADDDHFKVFTDNTSTRKEG